MQTVKVKDVAVGKGKPKVIASLMGGDLQALLLQAPQYNVPDVDIVELRIDHFNEPQNMVLVRDVLQQLRGVIRDKPILLTFRTAREGGEREITAQDYVALNKAIASTGLVDMIDLELFTGDEFLKEVIEFAHGCGVKVICSNHDFEKTPSKEEIIKRLCKMQDLGADILKIALMPQSKSDVLILLEATLEMYEVYAKRPLITMSMGKDGVVSRLAGGIFGSVATFGALEKASAPGQVNVKDLHAVLNVIHADV